jgi:hypothetical protein
MPERPVSPNTRSAMTQSSVRAHLTVAERTAILDRTLAKLTSEPIGHTLICRKLFSAISNVRWKLKKSNIFWGVVLTVFTVGLGLIFWGLYFLTLIVNRRPYHRIDVTPTGEIVRTKLKADDPSLSTVLRGSR